MFSMSLPPGSPQDSIFPPLGSSVVGITRGYLNTNSGIRRILLPGLRSSHCPRHCSSGSGSPVHRSLVGGDCTQALVTWPLPTRTQKKSLPWFGSRKTLSLQTSCCLLPSTPRAWLCRLPWSIMDRLCATISLGGQGVALGQKGLWLMSQPWSSCFKVLLVCILQEVGTSIHNSPACQPRST